MHGAIVASVLSLASLSHVDSNARQKFQCVAVDDANDAFLGQPENKLKAAQQNALDACQQGGGQDCQIFGCKKLGEDECLTDQDGDVVWDWNHTWQF